MGENPPASTGDAETRVHPWAGETPGGGHGSPPQYPSLENPTGRGAWRAAVHGVAESGKTAATTHAHTQPCLNVIPGVCPQICKDKCASGQVWGERREKKTHTLGKCYFIGDFNQYSIVK